MTRCDVEIDPIDQVDFLDLAREAEKGAPQQRSEGTRVVQAMDDEEDAPDGAALEAEYKALVNQGPKQEDLGTAKDESGVEIFDQTQDRQLSDDEWDEEIRANKGEIEEIVKKQKSAKKKAKKSELRKKARKKADEELGIEWVDDDEGEK